MVPIGSPFVVSYLTAIVSNIVSLVVFKIFDTEVLWPRSRTVQGLRVIPGQHSWCQSIAQCCPAAEPR